MHKKRPFVQKMKKFRLAMLQCEQIRNRPQGWKDKVGVNMLTTEKAGFNYELEI